MWQMDLLGLFWGREGTNDQVVALFIVLLIQNIHFYINSFTNKLGMLVVLGSILAHIHIA